MTGSGFVRNRPGMNLLIDESSHQRFYIGEQTAAIVAHVDNQPVARRQCGKNHVEVALTYRYRKVAVIHISIVVFQNLILDATCAFVIEIQIVLVDDSFVVVHRIFLPNPVSRHIPRRNEVGVAIFQFL